MPTGGLLNSDLLFVPNIRDAAPSLRERSNARCEARLASTWRSSVVAVLYLSQLVGRGPIYAV